MTTESPNPAEESSAVLELEGVRLSDGPARQHTRWLHCLRETVIGLLLGAERPAIVRWLSNEYGEKFARNSDTTEELGDGFESGLIIGLRIGALLVVLLVTGASGTFAGVVGTVILLVAPTTCTNSVSKSTTLFLTY